MPAPRIFPTTIGTTAEQAVDETAEGGAYMGRNGVANTAAILVEVSVAGIMDADFDPPMATA